MDENGQEIIKPIFERVSEFNEGLAWAVVEKNEKWFSGFINESGDWVIEPTFSGYGWSMTETSLFSDGLAPIQSIENRKMMYINKLGEAVTDPIYDTAGIFSEQRAITAINDRFGYIDELGNQVINHQYGIYSLAFIQNNRFSEGLAAVRFDIGEDGLETDNNFGYINKNGEVVFEPEDYYGNAFSEGFAMIKDLLLHHHLPHPPREGGEGGEGGERGLFAIEIAEEGVICVIPDHPSIIPISSWIIPVLSRIIPAHPRIIPAHPIMAKCRNER